MSVASGLDDKRVRKLAIMGIRGIPGAHGGFETFAEHFATYLVSRGWQVTVYCQEDSHVVGSRRERFETEWQGVRRIHIPVARAGALGTAIFDFKSILHARTESGPVLVLGYNTAVLNLILRLAKRVVLMNMDGIEWKREKWSRLLKIWLYLNERAGAAISHYMVADHPLIAEHLSRGQQGLKISMIPYAADEITEACTKPLNIFGLTPRKYFIAVARVEPENSVFEVVAAFSKEPRGSKLLVIGSFDPEASSYHARIKEVASKDVIFAGAIYEKETLKSLRFHALAYCHGHTVGGTNPSLVEALGAGNAIIAQDNPFNRWVTGNAQLYFRSIDECAVNISQLLDDQDLAYRLSSCARSRHKKEFTWNKVHSEYEELIVSTRKGWG